MARIPLAYPKIPDSFCARLEQCVAFEKYDGTNLHWVWEKELGWYAFGTRRDRFDLDDSGVAEFNAAHPGLEQAPLVFERELAGPLTQQLTSLQFYESPEIVVFTEFFGPASFAGSHQANDRMRLVLLDVVSAAGQIGPEQFVADFGSLDARARVVYQGRFTGQFAADVRAGHYDVEEGVVCKGGETGSVWMAKIKTDSYMARLMQSFSNKWKDYWE